MFIAVYNATTQTDAKTTIGKEQADGFQAVGQQFEVQLCSTQIAALKKAFGVKNGIDIPKCTAVYNLMLNGKANHEIERLDYYAERRLKTIRATLLPTIQKNCKK
jgi:hypothetical protein